MTITRCEKMLCFHLLVIYLFNYYSLSVRGNDINIFSTQNGGGISPECTEESKVWTGCLLSNPECLYGQGCDANSDGGNDEGNETGAEEFNCQLIPALCVKVSCCKECHFSGLELLNCEADARTCSNECDIPTGEPSTAPTLSMTPSNTPITVPSLSPSKFPSTSSSLTIVPSDSPSDVPSKSPTKSLLPSLAPTDTPSSSPSNTLTTVPSLSPSTVPSTSSSPTTVPSDSPSNVPSKSPTKSLLPSLAPTDTPSSSPSEKPTVSSFPSQRPTKMQSEEPSAEPTGEPSTAPTNMHPEELSFSSIRAQSTLPPISTLAPTPTPIPPELVAKSDYRCGVTEADARSNCKPECTVSIDCLTGETCWTTHINYCHMMPPNHPQCADIAVENTLLRCGYDEMAARGFCGTTCTNELDCIVPGEKCFPLMRNMCECFEEQDVLDQVIPGVPAYANYITNNFRRNAIEQQQQQKNNREQHSQLHRDLVDDNTELTNHLYFELAKQPLKQYYDSEDSKSDATPSSEHGQVIYAPKEYSAAVIAANSDQYLLIGSTSLLLAISYLLL